ncbi:MAG TPA: hypothetical protein VJR89_43125, partial [Polyangiales bacterium]|nr:hypothetical protein [Polyangiales bacterium]
GELPDAQRALQSIQALSEPARDVLNREPARARKLFDNCVMTAYLYERADQHAAALRQMLACSHDYPRFRPDGRAYPAELRRLFEEAALQQSQLQPSTLRVTSVGRSGCGVRMNGLPLGKTPLASSDLRAGSVRVQLECEAGSAGRIHVLQLQPGDNDVTIDPAFEAAVHSRGGLWLSYANEVERDKRAASDGLVIASALGVRVVMLWNTPGPFGQDIALRPLGAGPSRELARTSFAADSGYASGGPRKLANALIDSTRPARASPQPDAVPPPSAAVVTAVAPPPPAASPLPPAPAARAYTQQHAAAGAILAVVGGASCAVSWFVYGERQSMRKVVADTSELNKYKKLGAIALTTAAVGTSLLSVSEYFWLPDDPGVPPFGWAVGVLGLGVGATAIALSFTVSDCQLGDDRVSCQHFWSDHFFGPMLFLHALPLMSVPLWYALRAEFRPAGVQIGWTGEGISLQGQF